MKHLFKNRFVIIDRWIFKIKYDIDERIFRYKARWVIHKYKQKKNIDHYVTWAKVVKAIFFRTLFNIIATRRMRIEQMNIIIAFLYELFNENVYVI